MAQNKCGILMTKYLWTITDLASFDESHDYD